MSDKNAKPNVAVAIAKKPAVRPIDEVVEMSTGVKVRLVPVPSSIINEAQNAIPEPPVPMWYNEAKEREEENPDHPAYGEAIARWNTDKNLAVLDAMILFGVLLVDPIPDENDWYQKLQLRIKFGLTKVDLSVFDITDPVEREFVYKKYVCVAPPDYPDLMLVSGLTEEDIAQAQESFRDN